MRGAVLETVGPGSDEPGVVVVEVDVEPEIVDVVEEVATVGGSVVVVGRVVVVRGTVARVTGTAGTRRAAGVSGDGRTRK